MQGILQDLGIDLFVLRSDLFDIWQLSRLIIERDTDTTHAVRFFSFLKCRIVQLAIMVKCELESITLLIQV